MTSPTGPCRSLSAPTRACLRTGDCRTVSITSRGPGHAEAGVGAQVVAVAGSGLVSAQLVGLMLVAATAFVEALCGASGRGFVWDTGGAKEFLFRGPDAAEPRTSSSWGRRHNRETARCYGNPSPRDLPCVVWFPQGDLSHGKAAKLTGGCRRSRYRLRLTRLSVNRMPPPYRRRLCLSCIPAFKTGAESTGILLPLVGFDVFRQDLLLFRAVHNHPHFTNCSRNCPGAK